MPIYEYKCKDCGKIDEVYHNKPIKDVVHPEICPHCNSTEYKQLISLSTFDVPGGSMYDGKRDWKKNLSTYEQADVLMGDKDPY